MRGLRFEKALITGASSGLGAAFARVLPTTTSLLLTGRDQERLRTTAAELAGGPRSIGYRPADLAVAADRDALIQWALEAEIDLLICNAGLGSSGRFLESPLAHVHQTIAVNLVGTLELLHALLPGMIDRACRNGRRAGVVIVSNMAAFGSAPGFASYAASKQVVSQFEV